MQVIVRKTGNKRKLLGKDNTGHLPLIYGPHNIRCSDGQ